MAAKTSGNQLAQQFLVCASLMSIKENFVLKRFIKLPDFFLKKQYPFEVVSSHILGSAFTGLSSQFTWFFLNMHTEFPSCHVNPWQSDLASQASAQDPILVCQRLESVSTSTPQSPTSPSYPKSSHISAFSRLSSSKIFEKLPVCQHHYVE